MRIYETEFGQYMLAANISAIELAKKCKVGKKTIYNWIKKVNKPNDIPTLNLLAESLNIDVSILKEYFRG